MPETVVVAIVAGTLNLTATTVAAYFALRASRFSRPVGNGFTEHVKEELRYLRERHDQHLERHHGL